jgi:hypothetical protein
MSLLIYNPILGDSSILGADFSLLRNYLHRSQHGTWPDPNLIINTTPLPAETDLEFACDD